MKRTLTSLAIDTIFLMVHAIFVMGCLAIIHRAWHPCPALAYAPSLALLVAARVIIKGNALNPEN